MHIVHYCQYVLGMGHLFRSLEIARALAEKGARITFVTGGPPVAVPMPDGVEHHQLPPLMMDADFSEFVCMGGDVPEEQDSPEQRLARIKEQRAAQLQNVVAANRPDVFLVELFPFGRNAFSFELLPVLEAIHNRQITGANSPTRVLCSLRDILVEKEHQQKFEERVLSRLNRLFDGLLVHTDPAVITLAETFSRMQDITVPVYNTGYVTPLPDTVADSAVTRRRHALRKHYGVEEGVPLIIASAGSGSVGAELLRATVNASVVLQKTLPHHLLLFTGPYMDQLSRNLMERDAGGLAHIQLHEFTDTFVEHLCAADLSVSMAGYNTTMNLLAARTFGLVYPFAGNREQRMRSERLERHGLLRILTQEMLAAETFAACMTEALRAHPCHLSKPPSSPQVNLQGAARTAELIFSRYSHTDGTP